MKENKIIKKERLIKEVAKLKNQKKKIVLISGSWDMLHIGHMRYIEQAKSYGDILIVGVDSDSKIKKQKGPDRPIVHQQERLEMLSHLQNIDYLYVKYPEDAPLSLIKLTQPDYLVVSKTSDHSKHHLNNINKSCKNVIILPAQATTSTTAKIRKLHIDGMKKMANSLINTINNILKNQ